MIATRPTTSTALGSLPRDLILAGVAAAPIAALLTIALHGRTTLGGLSLRWASTFAVIALITVAWAEGIQAAIYAFKEITSPYWLNEKRLRDHKITMIGEKNFGHDAPPIGSVTSSSLRTRSLLRS